MSKLYHVTSKEAAKAIKISGKFWLTNYAKQNSSDDSFVWRSALHYAMCNADIVAQHPNIARLCYSFNLKQYYDLVASDYEMAKNVSNDFRKTVMDLLFPCAPTVYTMSFVRGDPTPTLIDRYGCSDPAFLLVNEQCLKEFAHVLGGRLEDVIYWNVQNPEPCIQWIEKWLKCEFARLDGCQVETNLCGPKMCKHSNICGGNKSILGRLQWDLCGIVKAAQSNGDDENKLKLKYTDWSVENEVRLLVRRDELGADIALSSPLGQVTIDRIGRVVDTAYGLRPKIEFVDRAEVSYGKLCIGIDVERATVPVMNF